MDPRQPVRDFAPALDPHQARLPSRRGTFPSRQAAFDWLEGRGVFAGWQPEPFDAYITDGFEIVADGHVTLRCTPEIEQSILRRLVPAIQGTLPTEIFEHLSEIRCPVLIASTEHSNPRFARMADIAQRLLSCITIEHLSGVGHAALQVAPDRIASLARHFWTRPANPHDGRILDTHLAPDHQREHPSAEPSGLDHDTAARSGIVRV